jgi:hypothetical protein
LEDRPGGGDFLQARRHQGLPTLSGRLRNAKQQGFVLKSDGASIDARNLINVLHNYLFCR